MEMLVKALGPAFAGGLAIQQLLELLDPAFGLLPKKLQDQKKAILGLVALVLGLVMAFVGHLQVLEALGVHEETLDRFTTGLIISSGTQGINSLLKFMGYAKEEKKADAITKADPSEKKALAAGRTV